LTVTIAIGGAIVCLTQPPGPSDAGTTASDFEELPELKASEILKPEILKGPNYTVPNRCRLSSGMNQFTIDSEFGVFQADGSEMLRQRVKEIYTIAKLKDVSRMESGGHKPMLVVISGQMSPRLQQELQTRGITVHDRFSPGPLK